MSTVVYGNNVILYIAGVGCIGTASHIIEDIGHVIDAIVIDDPKACCEPIAGSISVSGEMSLVFENPYINYEALERLRLIRRPITDTYETPLFRKERDWDLGGRRSWKHKLRKKRR